MGGSVFASGANPLYTPRMPLSIYHKAKKQCIASLKPYFLHVVSAIEGPAKPNFGDIDILVCTRKVELPLDIPNDFTLIRHALSAVRAIQNRPTANYAIPWPVVPGSTKHEKDVHDKPQFIQVDVRVCDSVEKMQWMLFKHGHGDLWNILGTTIRPYGLTVDEECLSIRIPEIERANKKLAKVPLTSDPREVMDVLGLQYAGYWDMPFATVDDLFEYAATSPLFWVQPAAEGNDMETQLAKRRQNLKSNDRKRMKNRPVYSRWIEEFLPRCGIEGRFVDQRKTRDSVRDEVFLRFDVEGEYMKRLRQFNVEEQQRKIKEYIHKFFNDQDFADDLYRGCAMKGLKRYLLTGDTTFGIGYTQPLKHVDGTYIMKNVEEFIDLKFSSVAEAQLAEHNAKRGQWVAKLDVEKKLEELDIEENKPVTLEG